MYCAYVSIGYIKCDLIDVAPLLYVGIVPPVATGVEEPEECDPVGDDDDVFVDCPEAAMEGDQIVLYGTYYTYVPMYILILCLVLYSCTYVHMYVDLFITSEFFICTYVHTYKWYTCAQSLSFIFIGVAL